MINQRLDTGMTIAEAIQKASHWWDTVGRVKMRDVANKEIAKDVVKYGGPGPNFKIKGDVTDTLKTGIMLGLEWQYLTKRDQMQIVKAWHHNFVRVKEVANQELGLLI